MPASKDTPTDLEQYHNFHGLTLPDWGPDFELPFAKYVLRDIGFNDAHEIRGKSLNYERIHYSEYMAHLESRGLLKKYLRDLFERRDVSTAAGGICTVPKGYGKSVLPPDDHLDGWIINQAVEWLGNNEKSPYFLWVGPPGPHDPYDPPGKYTELYDKGSFPEPIVDDGAFPEPEQNVTIGFTDCSAEDITESRLNYFRSLTFLDDYIGRMIKTLEQRGQMNDTWIIFTSDHGDLLGDHGMMLKSTFHDGSARVPLIIRPPDKYMDATRGTVVDGLVSLIDLSATITDIMQAEPVSGGQGISLKSEVLGDEFSGRDVVYSDVWNFSNKKYSDSDAEKLLMICTGDWKLVVNKDSGEALRLTDMHNDPEERRNLKDDMEYNSIIEKLKREFLMPYLDAENAAPDESWHPAVSPLPASMRRIPPLEMWAKGSDILKK